MAKFLENGCKIDQFWAVELIDQLVQSFQDLSSFILETSFVSGDEDCIIFLHQGLSIVCAVNDDCALDWPSLSGGSSEHLSCFCVSQITICVNYNNVSILLHLDVKSPGELNSHDNDSILDGLHLNSVGIDVANIIKLDCLSEELFFLHSLEEPLNEVHFILPSEEHDGWHLS